MNNTHIHLQRDIDTANIIPLRRIVDTNGFAWVLHILQPFSNKDMLDRYRLLLQYSKLTSEEIYLKVKSEYPEGTVFWALSIDMTCIGKGGVKRKHKDQVYELLELKNKYGIKIFVHIDPRNIGYLTTFITDKFYRDKFDGVKLYTPMGYVPYDLRLEYVYRELEKQGKSVITHCTKDSTIHYLGSKRNLKLLLNNVQDKELIQGKSRKELCNAFMHPLGYKRVWAKFPKLKIAFAHFGRGNEWDKIILDLMKEYEGCYVDISYTMYDASRWADFKLRMIDDKLFSTRCLFGSDFYMNVVEGEEKQFSKELRVYLGEEIWKKITIDNPMEFL